MKIKESVPVFESQWIVIGNLISGLKSNPLRFAHLALLKLLVCCAFILSLSLSSQVVQAAPPQDLLDKACTDEQAKLEIREKWDSLDEASKQLLEKYWKDRNGLNELYGQTAERLRQDMEEWERQKVILKLKLTAQGGRAIMGGLSAGAQKALDKLPSASPLDKGLKKLLKKVLKEIQEQGKIDDEDAKAIKKSLEKIDELVERIQDDDDLQKRILPVKKKIEEIDEIIKRARREELRLNLRMDPKGKPKTAIPLTVSVSGGCPPYSVTVKDSASANAISIPNTRDSEIKTSLTFPNPGKFYVDVEVVDSVNKRLKDTTMVEIADPNEKPGIKVTKTASAASIKPGEKVTYKYSVTNSGNVQLESVTVKDDKCSPVSYVRGGTNFSSGRLDPNESWEYECTVTLNATTQNTVTVNAFSLTNVAVIAQATAKVDVTAPPPAAPCPPPKVVVPDVVNKAEDAAKNELKQKQLVGVVLQRDYSDTIAEGLVMMQDPSGGECIDPNSIVNLWVSRGHKTATAPQEPAKKFTADFDCGSSFELSPGDFLGRSCGIIVRGWESNTERRVVVKVEYNKKSGIEIFPGDTSAPPSLMYTAGIQDTYDRYIFSESFKAKDNAPPGTTTVTITVSQEGVGSVTLTVSVSVLSKGLLPSSGEGTRPPAAVATGSGGEYCVWRYKLFGDPPPCFHFVKAVCSEPRYNNPANGYELVGSNMTWEEGSARMAQLSSYFDDAYGCRGLAAGVKDTDGDGVPDEKDGCPTDPEKKSKGVCDCLVSDRDSDYDGTPDCIDKCPDDINKTSPGVCGCGTPDKDSDGDGVMDCNDECPSDPDKTKIGECGCFAPDVDSDGDGELDCNDRCPKDPAKKKDEGYCGCGKPETDKDGDAWPDCIDNCPNDPYKTDDPGICGCGNPETDSDSDGVPDCKDKCPNDPDKTEPGTAGCGKPEKTACTKYDPTNPACEPAGSKGDKPPVDPNVGSGFQEGMPGGKPPVKGGPEGGGEQQPGTYTKPPKPADGEEGGSTPPEGTPPLCFDAKTHTYGPCPPRKPLIPVLPPPKPGKEGSKPKPPSKPAGCPEGCHMKPDGSGCHCPEGGSGEKPPSSPPPPKPPATSTPSGGGGG